MKPKRKKKLFKRGRDTKVHGVYTAWENILNEGLNYQDQAKQSKMYASTSGLCTRQSVGMTQLPKDQKVERNAAFEFYVKTGSAYEKVFKKAFLNQNVYLDDEVSIQSVWEDLELSGRIDFILRNPYSGKPIPMELKTCGELPDSPKRYHLAQLLTYMVLTGSKDGLIWYQSRKVADWQGRIYTRCFEIKMNEDYFDETVRVLAESAIYQKYGVFPNKSPHVLKSHCGFCVFKGTCWENHPTEIFGFDYEDNLSQKKRKMLESKIEKLIEEITADQQELYEMFCDEYASS